MNKKFISLVLSGLIVLSNTPYIEHIYADENTKADKLIENQDTKSQQVIYLEKGEGDKGVGNGTKDRPYQNIHTALEKIENGGTLKLVGTVVYTEYEVHTDKSALPLFINKNITIEGDGDAVLYVSGSIQLGADVTFKNLHLELVPEVIFDVDESNKPDNPVWGNKKPRSNAIFAAGHTLTLDNVNTKNGTSSHQDEDRPYISGGLYKDQGKLGKKAVINIKNPNRETKFKEIYAGDYWKERTFDVEINIDGPLLDTTINTGGLKNTLNGDVTVNLGSKSNVTKFDKTNQNGKLNVNIKSGTTFTNLDVAGVNDLTLEENVKFYLPKNSKFEVDNVTLKNNAIIDFRYIQGNPIVNGNFKGEENVDSTREGGYIILNNKQTLDIKGLLTGKTGLNYVGSGPIYHLLNNHTYVKANKNSNGSIFIDDEIFEDFELEENITNDVKSWTAKENSGIVVSPEAPETKPEINITDIKGHWAEESINRFIASGYINGYADKTFRPNNSITRAEFIKIFNKYFGLTNKGGNSFRDITNHWAKDEIDIAVTNGIVNGFEDNTFRPNDPITREQAATIISNYKKLSDNNFDKINKYKDSNDVSSWAKSSVEGVLEKGYMNGYSDNTFKPKNNITRAEAVSVLSRIQ